jgi:hypothetical protein
MGGLHTRRSRRSVLHGVSSAFAAAISVRVLTGHARAQSSEDHASEKMTKARAEYQTMPNGIYSCATCMVFVPPDICKVVEGEVSANGWCRAFALAD